MSAIRFGDGAGFVGYSSDVTRIRNQRRALIVRRVRAMKTRARKLVSIRTRNRMSASAESRRDRDRELRGLDPIDTSIETGGNPDHDIDQLPDALLEDR